MLPVHNHSEYSALDGYSRPSEIAARITELGLPGAFLTDHGTVAGLAEFSKAMKGKDLFVGYGMEAYQALTSRKITRHDNNTGAAFKKGEDSFHLLLLAKSPEGYKNLLRISDDAHRTGFYYDPRVDWELLKKYREGLICTTACMGSLACQALLDGNTRPISDLHEIFGEDLRIEISTYDTDEQRKLNKDLVRVATDRGIQLIYANDAHYADPDLYDVHEALLCAQYNKRLLEPKPHGNADDPSYYHPHCLYIMGEDEVRERLSHLPQWAVDEAIAASDELMEICSFELEKSGLYLPKFKVPEEYEDSADMLEALVAQGVAERYEMTDEVLDRVEYEFDAIVSAGLQDYFLIVWDFINYALSHGIMVGPGRGSVGGSILAYALGITAIDPLKYGLQFERFWNPGRADGLPDIDTDFEQSSRQFMIEYVKRKYGEGNVLPIGNHIFMRPRSAIDKAGSVLYEKPPYGPMESIKKIIERTTDAGQQKPWEEMWELLGEWAESEGEPHPLEEYKEKYPELFELAEFLSGRISTYGVHASAVVISEVDLTDHLPARMASDDDKRKVLCTQAEMKQVEKAGFPKFDFLGLRNLDTIMMAAIYSGDFGDPDVLGPKLLRMIEERSKGSLAVLDPDLREACVAIVDHFRNGVNYNALAASYWDLLDRGQTLGLFQIEESSSPRRIAKHLRPRNIEDLAAIVALNRPGPLRDKDDKGRSTVDRFLLRRNGEEEAEFPHPILEPILANTYGDFVYQEQVIAYFRAIGYSLSDADHIRKILGKKLVSEMQAEKPRYLERAQNFMPLQTAEVIWHKIEEFSKYSFNKAHAVGYGIITGWTTYAKRKWPLEFIMASITTVGSTTNGRKKIPSYINEARRIGVKVLPPDINRSQVTISKSEGEILYGLRDVKGIGPDAAAWIKKWGPFNSPEAFYHATVDDEYKATHNGKKVIVVKSNHRQALMDAGAFDSFGYRLSKCPKCDGKGRCRIDPAKRILDPCPDCETLGFIRCDIPDVKERAAAEEELLGIALTNPHQAVIDVNREEIDALDSLTEAENENKTRIWVPGVVRKVDQKQATWHLKPGVDPTWARVTVEWEGDQITFAAFPEQYKRFKYLLVADTVGKWKLETGKKGPQLIEGKKFTN